MRKIIEFALCLCLTAALCACMPMPADESPFVSATLDTTGAASATPCAATPDESVSSATDTAASATPAPSPMPEEPQMYSSFAHLVSFDPDTGVAEFDYFDILKGDEAVDYLIEHDGYTEAEAQSLVNDYADSEFVEKNTNDQLRAVNIDEVSLSLMYQPSGKMVEDATPVPSTASDFRTVFETDPSLLLDSFFYYIHVESDEHVSLVEQVYWP